MTITWSASCRQLCNSLVQLAPIRPPNPIGVEHLENGRFDEDRPACDLDIFWTCARISSYVDDASRVCGSCEHRQRFPQCHPDDMQLRQAGPADTKIYSFPFEEPIISFGIASSVTRRSSLRSGTPPSECGRHDTQRCTAVGLHKLQLECR